MASDELNNELSKGFLIISSSREELERCFGKLIPSRMATLVKVKAGATEVRLIHDLRRSLVNSLAVIQSRVMRLKRSWSCRGRIASRTRLTLPCSISKILCMNLNAGFWRVQWRSMTSPIGSYTIRSYLVRSRDHYSRDASPLCQ